MSPDLGGPRLLAQLMNPHHPKEQVYGETLKASSWARFGPIFAMIF